MLDPNPFELLRDLAGGYLLPRCLHVVADLGVADALGDTPLTAAELAPLVNADRDSLHRVMRLLAGHGVFEMRNDCFGHTAASRLLCSDHPQSMRAFARMMGLGFNWATLGKLDHTVRTGRPAGDEVMPGGIWAWIEGRPEESAIFNGAMAGKAHGQVAGVLRSYDFSRFGVIGDIGGGRGHLLRGVLDAVPAARGLLFDLPHVIDEAATLASSRATLVPGDFFKDALPVCDAYLAMEVIHDWADPEALAILQAIRRAAPVDATLLLIEVIVPDEPGPDWAKTLDVLMLVLLGGRQRTVEEYRSLLDRADFSLARTIDTGAGISILEARPV